VNIQQRLLIAGIVASLLGVASWYTISKSVGEIKMGIAPICQTSTDIKRLDGQQVRLVGIYRKHLMYKKKPRPFDNTPPVFTGHIFIEVEGSPEVYSPYQLPDAKSMVRLGLQPRSPEEIERFVDKKVIVEGKLLVDVSSLTPSPEVAQAAQPPVLLEFREVLEYQNN
jgi:hypothetical protein